ncbi:uncharacterized [Tachysurus ichikawai]
MSEVTAQMSAPPPLSPLAPWQCENSDLRMSFLRLGIQKTLPFFFIHSFDHFLLPSMTTPTTPVFSIKI